MSAEGRLELPGIPQNGSPGTGTDSQSSNSFETLESKNLSFFSLSTDGSHQSQAKTSTEQKPQQAYLLQRKIQFNRLRNVDFNQPLPVIIKDSKEKHGTPALLPCDLMLQRHEDVRMYGGEVSTLDNTTGNVLTPTFFEHRPIVWSNSYKQPPAYIVLSSIKDKRDILSSQEVVIEPNSFEIETDDVDEEFIQLYNKHSQLIHEHQDNPLSTQEDLTVEQFEHVISYLEKLSYTESERMKFHQLYILAKETKQNVKENKIEECICDRKSKWKRKESACDCPAKRRRCILEERLENERENKVQPELICEICLSSGDVRKCAGCDIIVHPQCYGFTQQKLDLFDKKLQRYNSGEWYCDYCYTALKKEKKKRICDRKPDQIFTGYKSLACILCGERGGAMRLAVMDGDTVTSFKESTWCHVLCALCTDGVRINEAKEQEFFRIPNKESIGTGTSKCTICGKYGGTLLTCSAHGCSCKLHPFCARKTGFFLKFTTQSPGYEVYCGIHSTALTGHMPLSFLYPDKTILIPPQTPSKEIKKSQNKEEKDNERTEQNESNANQNKQEQTTNTANKKSNSITNFKGDQMGSANGKLQKPETRKEVAEGFDKTRVEVKGKVKNKSISASEQQKLLESFYVYPHKVTTECYMPLASTSLSFPELTPLTAITRKTLDAPPCIHFTRECTCFRCRASDNTPCARPGDDINMNYPFCNACTDIVSILGAPKLLFQKREKTLKESSQNASTKGTPSYRSTRHSSKTEECPHRARSVENQTTFIATMSVKKLSAICTYWVMRRLGRRGIPLIEQPSPASDAIQWSNLYTSYQRLAIDNEDPFTVVKDRMLKTVDNLQKGLQVVENVRKRERLKREAVEQSINVCEKVYKLLEEKNKQRSDPSHKQSKKVHKKEIEDAHQSPSKIKIEQKESMPTVNPLTLEGTKQESQKLDDTTKYERENHDQTVETLPAKEEVQRQEETNNNNSKVTDIKEQIEEQQTSSDTSMELEDEHKEEDCQEQSSIKSSTDTKVELDTQKFPLTEPLEIEESTKRCNNKEQTKIKIEEVEQQITIAVNKADETPPPKNREQERDVTANAKEADKQPMKIEDDPKTLKLQEEAEVFDLKGKTACIQIPETEQQKSEPIQDNAENYSETSPNSHCQQSEEKTQQNGTQNREELTPSQTEEASHNLPQKEGTKAQEDENVPKIKECHSRDLPMSIENAFSACSNSTNNPAIEEETQNFATKHLQGCVDMSPRTATLPENTFNSLTNAPPFESTDSSWIKDTKFIKTDFQEQSKNESVCTLKPTETISGNDFAELPHQKTTTFGTLNTEPLQTFREQKEQYFSTQTPPTSANLLQDSKSETQDSAIQERLKEESTVLMNEFLSEKKFAERLATHVERVSLEQAYKSVDVISLSYILPEVNFNTQKRRGRPKKF